MQFDDAVREALRMLAEPRTEVRPSGEAWQVVVADQVVATVSTKEDAEEMARRSLVERGGGMLTVRDRAGHVDSARVAPKLWLPPGYAQPSSRVPAPVTPSPRPATSPAGPARSAVAPDPSTTPAVGDPATRFVLQKGPGAGRFQEWPPFRCRTLSDGRVEVEAVEAVGTLVAYLVPTSDGSVAAMASFDDILDPLFQLISEAPDLLAASAPATAQLLQHGVVGYGDGRLILDSVEHADGVARWTLLFTDLRPGRAAPDPRTQMLVRHLLDVVAVIAEESINVGTSSRAHLSLGGSIPGGSQTRLGTFADTAESIGTIAESFGKVLKAFGELSSWLRS